MPPHSSAITITPTTSSRAEHSYAEPRDLSERFVSSYRIRPKGHDAAGFRPAARHVGSIFCLSCSWHAMRSLRSLGSARDDGWGDGVGSVVAVEGCAIADAGFLNKNFRNDTSVLFGCVQYQKKGPHFRAALKESLWKTSYALNDDPHP